MNDWLFWYFVIGIGFALIVALNQTKRSVAVTVVLLLLFIFLWPFMMAGAFVMQRRKRNG